MRTPTGNPDQRWDVNAMNIPFGVGKKFGEVTAKTRVDAEAAARAAFGDEILVTLHGGRPRRRRQLARDLGDSTRGAQ